MRCLLLFGVLFLAASSLAVAQIQVSAQTDRTDFLLYERVDLLVTVSNVGGTDLVLDNNEGEPWLSFLVSKRSHGNYEPVRPERGGTFPALTLKVGESKTLSVNLTPLFSFREEADYRAAAVVDLPGAGQMISEAVPFTVLDGQVIWSQTRSADGSERVYSLIRFSPKSDLTELYLRVEDPTENVVYANIGLGALTSTVDPQAFFDPQGNIHILQPVSMGTYLYTRADAEGAIEHQGIFNSAPSMDPSLAGMKVAPRLAKLDDGNVIVLGGVQSNPNEQRERLSDSHAKPAPETTQTAALPQANPAQ